MQKEKVKEKEDSRGGKGGGGNRKIERNLHTRKHSQDRRLRMNNGG